ncbi:hypothetical protein CIN_01160 [Commensalibacter intestini A911]|uniref:Uncharacterized protein n=1 Tax=Commensalibacter intestini A911 TaxID=1088868 RepID=G6EZW1_9PROT|nr:hypothetical protein CIN_01160 [Commensalibacter intestini A911]
MTPSIFNLTKWSLSRPILGEKAATTDTIDITKMTSAIQRQKTNRRRIF